MDVLLATTCTPDDRKAISFCRELGLDVPESFAPEDENELIEAGDQVGYPCVLRLRGGAGAGGCTIARNREELLGSYRKPRRRSDFVYNNDQLLVQEVVPGLTHDVCVLFCHGEARAVLTQRRLWVYPGQAGVGTIVESTNEPELRDLACRMLRALQWHGPAQAEFKVDRESGRRCLIEINGRFWGTLGAAVYAGVHFPRLACQMALDGDVEPVRDYSVGRRFRYPIPFRLLALMEPGARWQALKAFFDPSRRTGCDLDWRDPMPLVAEAGFIGWRLWRRCFG